MLSEKYILNMFDIKPSKFSEYKKIGVFTNDELKARKFFFEITKGKSLEIRHHMVSENNMVVIFDNGYYYSWIKPNRNSIGNKVTKAYIDKNITLDEFNSIVYPICVLCSREDVEVF